ncbi:IS701 family transposase [Ktedonospora formicarum]|uniref:Transposase n=1 Tax=Ktedonospora formicarum TaxID=2778364 RepID=A0A8J3MX79_9CHLR|nr:IS701 family transposase [Ktedonospora formicarum]GHO51160.1 transposase [Ktedonospora formicarum]
MQIRIGAYFRRAEARNRAGRFVRALLSPVERKNGWQLAEELGERSPHGVQRLLAEADWDEEAVRDELRRYVVDHLGEADGVLVVDETGFLKKGKKSAGVANQYSGAAHGLANSQVGVFVLYASACGAAFLDRELYIPEEWLANSVRSREAGIPEEHTLTSKGELARRMLARAFAAGVPAQWVVGDTLYGYDELRNWLEEQHKHYVLAIPETHLVWVNGRQQPVGYLAALLPPEAWTVLSAGEGSQGARLYEWSWFRLPEGGEPLDGADEKNRESCQARFLLLRRSLSDPSHRAYYRVAGPATLTLPEAVRIAGRRWTIEEGIEEAKGEVGLDQYEVRTYRAWHRFMTLALLAHAVLAVVRHRTREKKAPASSLASH